MTRRVIELSEWETRDVRLDDADVTALIAHPQQSCAVEAAPARGLWRLTRSGQGRGRQLRGIRLDHPAEGGPAERLLPHGRRTPPGLVGQRRGWTCWSTGTCSRASPGCWRTLSSVPSGEESSTVTSNVASLSSPCAAGSTSGAAPPPRRLRPGRVPVRRLHPRHEAEPAHPGCARPGPPAAWRAGNRAQDPAPPALPARGGRRRKSRTWQWADAWQPSRLDRRYLPAVRLSALVLRRLVLSEAAGSTRACSFLVDMNQLYERFIEEGLRRRLQQADRAIRVIGQEQRHLDIENRLIDPARHRHTTRASGSLRPGLEVHPGRRWHGARGPSLQLLSYAIRHDIKDVALVYVLDPSRPAWLEDPVATIRHAGVRIHSWAVDLSQGPAQIESGMDSLAARILRLSSC